MDVAVDVDELMDVVEVVDMVMNVDTKEEWSSNTKIQFNSLVLA